MEEVVPEMKILCHKWDDLTDHDSGFHVGFILGKYGVEIFTPVAGMKAFKVHRDPKRANSMFTLERCVVSQANKEAILASTLKHAAEREAYLKNVKIHWDRQNKHMPGLHNFQVGKSEITISTEKLQNLLEHHLGTGQNVGKIDFGMPGFRERVDFCEIIGTYCEENSLKKIPTSKGVIHYDRKGGIHVVPSQPGK